MASQLISFTPISFTPISLTPNGQLHIPAQDENHSSKQHSYHAMSGKLPPTRPDPNRKWRVMRMASIIILTFLVGFTARLVAIALTDGLPVGEIAPDFVGRTLQGDEIRLADNRGKATMLVFWSPDCSACRHELPAIQAIAADPDRAFTLITVVSYSPPAEVNTLAEIYHLNFPIISDENGEISQRYEVHGIPFSYLINRPESQAPAIGYRRRPG